MVRSVRHAQAAEAALRARVAKAMAQIEALNQRGRGKKRFETVAALRQAVVAIVQRYGVEHLLWFRLTQHVTPRPVRAYRGQPARVDHDRQATVEVCVDEAALEAAVRRLGWRVYGTNQPVASLSLEQAVLAYRSEYQVERSLGRLKGRPLSLTPMYVQRDDHATGLIRLIIDCFAGVDAVGICRPPSVGGRGGEAGGTLCRQSEARNRPAHGRASARSV